MDLDFDINKFKKKMNIRLDVFDEWKPQNNAIDNRLINDMQEAIKNTAKTCFKRCANLQNPDYSKSEEECVQKCTIGLIENIENLMLKHDKHNVAEE